MKKVPTILYWVLAILAALAYLGASFAKLSGGAMMAQSFAHFGYPVWFMYVIGTCELLGALGLLFGSVIDKRLPRLAGLGLILIMLGAITSHALHDPITMAIPATILLIILLGFEYVAMPKDKVVEAPSNN